MARLLLLRHFAGAAISARHKPIIVTDLRRRQPGCAGDPAALNHALYHAPNHALNHAQNHAQNHAAHHPFRPDDAAGVSVCCDGGVKKPDDLVTSSVEM